MSAPRPARATVIAPLMAPAGMAIEVATIPASAVA
jgi:hypothetical protein